MFTIEDQAPPVKISFSPGTWIAVQFHSDVLESRCPNCFVSGRAACPYLGSAYAYFQIMTSAGDSVYFSSEFPSCVAVLDTAATIYGAPAYLPLKGYTSFGTLRYFPILLTAVAVYFIITCSFWFNIRNLIKIWAVVDVYLSKKISRSNACPSEGGSATTAARPPSQPESKKFYIYQQIHIMEIARIICKPPAAIPFSFRPATCRQRPPYSTCSLRCRPIWFLYLPAVSTWVAPGSPRGRRPLISLSAFAISKYDVTQSLWLAVMGNNPSFFKNCPGLPGRDGELGRECAGVSY